MEVFQQPFVWLGILIFICLVIRFMLTRKRESCVFAGFQIMPNTAKSEIFQQVYQNGGTYLFVVTDGVGGNIRAKEAACEIATTRISQLFEQKMESEDVRSFLKRACFQAHRAIGENINYSSGCSIGMLYVDKVNTAWVSAGNVGIYGCLNEIERLNELDIYKHQIKEHLLTKKISPEKVRLNLIKNELTSYLGCDNFNHVMLSPVDYKLTKGMKIMIASDALQQVVTPMELERILKRRTSVFDKKEQLQRQFLQCGTATTDDKKATAVIVEGFRQNR